MAMDVRKLNLVGYQLFTGYYARKAVNDLAMQAMQSALCARGQKEPATYRLVRQIRRMTGLPVYEIAEEHDTRETS